MGDMENEWQLGALYGRYRKWQDVAPAEDAAMEDTTPTGEVAGVAVTDAVTDAVTATETVAPTLVVHFEATATEDLRVGWAPLNSTQWVYEVALGFSGNTEVVARKHVSRNGGGEGKELELVSVFAGRTVSTRQFVSYWVVLAPTGALALGIGSEVGVNTLLSCVDPSPPSERMQRLSFTTWNHGAMVKNVHCESRAFVDGDMARMVPQVMVREDPLTNVDLLTEEQRHAYQQEYAASQKRVARFGGTLVAPDLKKLLDPKMIRRLQRTGAIERGFTTGIDMQSTAETDRREARMKRFETPQFAVEYSTETARALAEGLTQEEWNDRQQEKEKRLARAKKFGVDVTNGNGDAGDGGGSAQRGPLEPASRKVQTERCDVKAESVEPREDAIHVYSLDEHFQQVRTSDVLAYFQGYGPWYVEWLNDSSCTVVFEDAHTAGRALIALSEAVPPQSLPVTAAARASASTTTTTSATKPGDADQDVDMDGDEMAEVKDEVKEEATHLSDGMDGMEEATAVVPDEAFNRSQWRVGQSVGSASQPRHKRWRLLLRRATSDDFPPEKTGRKYHDRRSRASGGGGGGRQQRQRASRAHPYRDNDRRGRDRSRDRSRNDGRDDDRDRGRGRRRNRERRGPRDGSDGDDNAGGSTGGTPSNRVRMNDDGSIEFIRKAADVKQEPSQGQEPSKPAAVDGA